MLLTGKADKLFKRISAILPARARTGMDPYMNVFRYVRDTREFPQTKFSVYFYTCNSCKGR